MADLEIRLKKLLAENEEERKSLVKDAYMTIIKLSEIALKPDSAFTIQHLDFLIPRVEEAGTAEWLQKLKDMQREAKKKFGPKRLTPPTKLDITPNQVGIPLVPNGKQIGRCSAKGYHRYTLISGNQQSMSILTKPFPVEEFEAGLDTMKLGKAVGPDDIMTEMIAHLGPIAKLWLLNTFNICLQARYIPAHWKRDITIAVLKPGKDPNLPKSYQPISLLCITYKLFERLLLTYLSSQIDAQLIYDQAVFRPGKPMTLINTSR
ncbi:hypothetical protein SRHO_G00250610 [Serrasalmus rhombeus]